MRLRRTAIAPQPPNRDEVDTRVGIVAPHLEQYGYVLYHAIDIRELDCPLVPVPTEDTPATHPIPADAFEKHQDWSSAAFTSLHFGMISFDNREGASKARDASIIKEWQPSAGGIKAKSHEGVNCHH